MVVDTPLVLVLLAAALAVLGPVVAVSPGLASTYLPFQSPAPSEEGHFGRAVAVSDRTLIIGESRANTEGVAVAGIVYVYERDEVTRVFKLTASLSENPPIAQGRFGYAVDLDGDRLAVSAMSSGASAPGYVYVFRRSSDGSWAQEGRLRGKDAIEGIDVAFGRIIDLNGDYLVAGTHKHTNSATSGAGCVYVFHRNATTGEWLQQAQLLPQVADVDGAFGRWVSISLDPLRIAVGAAGSGDGYVVVYYHTAHGVVRSTDEWALLGKSLVAVSGEKLGRAVAIHGDSLVVGAAGAYTESVQSGAVYVYQITESNYTRVETLTPPVDAAVPLQNEGALFGSRLALDSTGTRLVVGALYRKHNGLDRSGAVYVYSRASDTSTTWSLVAEVPMGAPMEHRQLGVGVAISSSLVIAGANLEDANGVYQAGVSYVASVNGCPDNQVADHDDAACRPCPTGATSQFDGPCVCSDGNRVLASHEDTCSPGLPLVVVLVIVGAGVLAVGAAVAAVVMRARSPAAASASVRRDVYVKSMGL